MADIKKPTGPDEDNFPPPPGPPPGHNGLAMNPSGNGTQHQQPIPDSHSELYDYPPPPTQPHPSSTYTQNQQTPHQPPPPDSDGAPRKAGWGQRFSMLGSKAAAPFNMLANKLGSETFLPSTMDKEVEKAARILKSFCSKCLAPLYTGYVGLTSASTADGIYTDVAAPETVEASTTDAEGKPTTVAAKPKKNRTLLKIPSKVINRAVGLAIFTTARAGFHVSGATGSGVLVARLPDGSWSPPTGIQVHSVGAGIMIGIDIYDCVVVINTPEALAAFTKTRMSLGSDLAVVAGPWGAGGSVDFTAPQFKGKGKAEGEPIVEDAANRGAEGKPASLSASPTNEANAEKAGEQPTATTPPATGAGTSTERPAAGKERKPSAFKATIKGPTYSYVKSRGFYAGVQVDGTIVTERKDANAAFYGEPVAVHQVIQGDVPLVPGKENWVNVVKPLWDTILGAEGRHTQPGEGMSEMSPDTASGYGDGPSGYPTGFDPVSEAAPPPKPLRPMQSGSSATTAGAATAGVAAMNLGGGAPAETPGARAKAAEAAAESEMAREREARERREAAEEMARARESIVTAPPGYSEMALPGEISASATGSEAGGAAREEEHAPPAYVDDGTAKPGVGDTKAPQGGSSS